MCAGNFLSWETVNSLTQPIVGFFHTDDQAALREMPEFY